ncbi:MAG: formylmethanofuran dehydrogenase [Chloroflexi bacterium]|nr:MAG: formylmethanofuran dehydrogenase [Chloroflexota bacterium]
MTQKLSPSFEELLQISAKLHKHICPRQVLGVRMGMAAGKWLGLDLPQTNKRLLAIVETDGCGADGISAATGCWVGRRTLRMVDFGKMAATFIDTRSGCAVRIAPSHASRELAKLVAPDAKNRWEAYLLGYQRMTDEELLNVQPVELELSVEQLISRPGVRVNCTQCGEEIINEREVMVGKRPFCKACAGERYYRPLSQAVQQVGYLRNSPAPTRFLKHG